MGQRPRDAGGRDSGTERGICRGRRTKPLGSCAGIAVLVMTALACSESSPTSADDPDLDPNPITVVSASLPSGVVGAGYDAALSATGGDGAFTWSLASGELPSGVTLSADGVLAGTPESVGTSMFRVRAQSAGLSGEADLSISIFDALAISTTSLPDAVVDEAYSSTLESTGGDGSTTWSVSDGSLPAGLSLDGASGTIDGTPTAEGAHAFTVTATSGDGQSAERGLSIEVGSSAPTLLATEYCSDYGDAAIATFAATLLETTVRVALGVGPEEDLTCGLLSTLTSLNAKGIGLASIAGIQNLTSLTYLRLDENFGIEDISWLSGLTELSEELDLSENQITDLTPLAGLTKLQDLNVATNSITDVSALSGLTSLVDLNLASNDIGDISPVAGLTGLVRLGVQNNQVSELSSLTGLTALISLEAHNNVITDISALEGMTDLIEIWLHGNTGLADIQPLLNNSSMDSEVSVTLGGTSVSCVDVAALEALGPSVSSDCQQ